MYKAWHLLGKKEGISFSRIKLRKNEEGGNSFYPQKTGKVGIEEGEEGWYANKQW